MNQQVVFYKKWLSFSLAGQATQLPRDGEDMVDWTSKERLLYCVRQTGQHFAASGCGWDGKSGF